MKRKPRIMPQEEPEAPEPSATESAPPDVSVEDFDAPPPIPPPDPGETPTETPSHGFTFEPEAGIHKCLKCLTLNVAHDERGGMLRCATCGQSGRKR